MSNSEQTRRPRAFPGLDAELGPARPMSRADTEWLIEQVVERALEPEKTRRLRRTSPRALSVAAIVVVSSAAAATLVHQKFQRNTATSAPAVSAPQRQTRRPALGRIVPQRESPSSEGIRPNAEAVPSAETAPNANTPTPTREGAPLAASAAISLSPVQEAAIVDELSAANDLRRKAQWQAAEAAYRDVAAHYPRAPEAAVAQLAAAELRLEHLGDATGALRLYQSVPRACALGVEALFGVSRAYRALGDGAAEASALRSLLEAYPTSLQADSARERLKQLAETSKVP